MKLQITALFTLAFPALALAQGLATTVDNLGGLVDSLIPIAFSAALLFFFYGLAIFVLKSGGEDQARGKSIMLWGVIALFIMASITGIISFLGTSIGLDTNSGGNFNVPGVN